MRNVLRYLVPALSLLAAACDVTTTGDRGVATFTPGECGQAWCDLDTELATGSTVTVTLAAAGARDISGLSLASDDVGVAMTFPLGFDRWLVSGVGQGGARLVVLDHGREVDSTWLRVTSPARYSLHLETGPAFTSAPDYADQEVWVVPANGAFAFSVRPHAWNGQELMGRVNLQTELDGALFQSLAPSADLPSGELAFQPMLPGDYFMTVSSQGIFLDVVFEAR